MFGDQLFADIWAGSYTPELTLSSAEKVIKERLEDHVRWLATEIGIRNTTRPHALHAAAQYVQTEFERLGLRTESQKYMTSSGQGARNVEAVIRGTEKEGTLVIGAHYDTIDGPGANDNASGVAAMIEIASFAVQQPVAPKRTVRFVGFTNEEPPYFGTEDMGSRVYAQGLRRDRERIVGMICLETMGYYTTEARSQDVPHHLKSIYQNDIGNFVAFLSNPASQGFLKSVLKSFRKHSGFPSEGLGVPPSLMYDIALSDNESFWKAGFPAIMVTDTVYMRYKHYHELTDTPNKLNYPAFAKVTSGIAKAVYQLASE